MVSKLANFLVLIGDPLEGICSSAEISRLVKGGMVWHADSMTQVMRPGWQSHEDWEELQPKLPEASQGAALAESVGREQRAVP